MNWNPLNLKPRHNVPILGLILQRLHSGLPVSELSYNVRNLGRVEKRQESDLSLPVSSSCYPFWNSRCLPKCLTPPCRALLPSLLLSSSWRLTPAVGSTAPPERSQNMAVSKVVGDGGWGRFGLMMWEFKCHTGSGRRKGEMEAAFSWAPVIHRMSGRLSLIAPQVVMRIMLCPPIWQIGEQSYFKCLVWFNSFFFKYTKTEHMSAICTLTLHPTNVGHEYMLRQWLTLSENSVKTSHHHQHQHCHLLQRVAYSYFSEMGGNQLLPSSLHYQTPIRFLPRGSKWLPRLQGWREGSGKECHSGWSEHITQAGSPSPLLWVLISHYGPVGPYSAWFSYFNTRFLRLCLNQGHLVNSYADIQ